MNEDEDKAIPIPQSNSQIRSTFLNFLDLVKEAIGLEQVDTDWEKDAKEFFGVDITKLVSIKTEFPLYQQSQACYAINRFLKRHTKIVKVVGYKGESYDAPTYEEFQVKRETTMPLLSRAWIFTEWKKRKIVVNLLFDGNYSELCIFGIKSDEKVMHELSSEIKKWMKKYNFLRGERLEYLPRGTLGFLEFGKLDWESVILPKILKDKITLNLIFMLNNKKLCKKYNIPWRRGVLLAGIAGTGKTQMARVLCNMLDSKTTIIWATPKALYDEEKIKLLFDAGRYFAPSLLIIEDLDFIGKSRDFHTDPITGELLTQLDGNSPNYGVFVLATTNRPELLDKALVERPSRFDVKLIFDLPNDEDRLEMVKYFSIGKRFNGITHEDIAGMTSGLTGAYIKEIIVYGTLLSLRENKKFIEKTHIESAIHEVKEKIKKDGSIR